MLNQFKLILIREIRETFSGSSSSWFPIAFFVLCILLFPLGIGPNSNVLSEVSAGIIWVSALFSNLLSLDKLYKEDFEDGTLEQYYISNFSFVSLVLAKCLCHWLITGLPIVLISPFISNLIYMDSGENLVMFFVLLLGTPILTLIGSPIAALTLGITLRGPILAFVSLPFMVPVLIFGVSAVNASANNISYYSEIYLLVAILPLALVFSVLATISALRITWE